MENETNKTEEQNINPANDNVNFGNDNQNNKLRVFNKKISIEIAVGIILVVALIIGFTVWFTNKKQKSIPQNKPVAANVNLPQKLITNPDENKMVAIDETYSKNLKNVYCQGKDIISGADPATFEKINNFWAKDKNSVYNNCNKVDGVDMSTFQIINNTDFAKDKNNVYFPDYIGQGNIKFDAQTFAVLSGTYLKDKNQIVILLRAGGAHTLWQLKQADVNTFQALGGAFGKDKNYVYYDKQIVNNADLDTFKLTGTTIETAGNGQDKNNAYECSENEVCGTSCLITNLKTGKKTHDYFGSTSKDIDPVCFK